jgi:hypothetical protein
MTRTGTRRARGAVDAGSSTGVATAVLALLSAGALATLGLVTATEISGGFADGLGRGRGTAPVPPGKVVVAGEKPDGGSGGTADGGGRGSGGTQDPVAGPTLVPPLPADLTNDLPIPAGVDSSPVPAPTDLPTVPPAGPGSGVALPPPVEPGLRTLAVRGRSALAPGHTKSPQVQRAAAEGRSPVREQTAAQATVPATTAETDDRPAVVFASVPAEAIAGTSAAAAAPGRLVHAAKDHGRGVAKGKGKGAPAVLPGAVLVVPTPAVTALGGRPAGAPPGLAKGRADR